MGRLSFMARWQPPLSPLLIIPSLLALWMPAVGGLHLREVLRNLHTAQLPKPTNPFHNSSAPTAGAHSTATWCWDPLTSSQPLEVEYCGTAEPGYLLQCPLDSQKIKALLPYQMVEKQAASPALPLSSPCLPFFPFSKLQPHQVLYHFNGLPKFRIRKEKASLIHLAISQSSLVSPSLSFILFGVGGEGGFFDWMPLGSLMGRWLALVLLVLWT